MILPNPAVAERLTEDTDEVTETTDAGKTEKIFMANPTLEQVPGESTFVVAYDSGDEQKGFQVPSLIDQGSHLETPDGTIKIRPVDPYDAIILAPAAGIAQPVEVVRAEVLQGGGNLAQELDAVVAPDNTVATLLLETGLGTFVRYGGDWQQLSDDSTSLEDMALVAVGPDAVDIYDAGEAANTTVSVFDLPTHGDVNGVEFFQDPSDAVEPEDEQQILTASGISIPNIETKEDLSLAVRYASAHPGARWFVAKKAKALGALDQVPTEWQSGVVLPFVTRAAG